MLAPKWCCYHNCVQTISKANCLGNADNLSTCQCTGIYLAPEADTLAAQNCVCSLSLPNHPVATVPVPCQKSFIHSSVHIFSLHCLLAGLSWKLSGENMSGHITALQYIPKCDIKTKRHFVMSLILVLAMEIFHFAIRKETRVGGSQFTTFVCVCENVLGWIESWPVE